MYPLKDDDGIIKGHTQWPNNQTDQKIDETSQEWSDHLNIGTATQEQDWVNSEMEVVRDAIDELEDGDPRGRADISSWRSYRKKLRNRVTDGVIINDPDTAGRPDRPL